MTVSGFGARFFQDLGHGVNEVVLGFGGLDEDELVAGAALGVGGLLA